MLTFTDDALQGEHSAGHRDQARMGGGGLPRPWTRTVRQSINRIKASPFIPQQELGPRLRLRTWAHRQAQRKWPSRTRTPGCTGAAAGRVRSPGSRARPCLLGQELLKLGRPISSAGGASCSDPSHQRGRARRPRRNASYCRSRACTTSVISSEPSTCRRISSSVSWGRVAQCLVGQLQAGSRGTPSRASVDRGPSDTPPGPRLVRNMQPRTRPAARSSSPNRISSQRPPRSPEPEAGPPSGRINPWSSRTWSRGRSTPSGRVCGGAPIGMPWKADQPSRTPHPGGHVPARPA